MDEQTIEMQIKSNSQQAISSLKEILNQLNLERIEVEKVSTTVDKNGKAVIKNLTTIEKNGDKAYKVIQRMDKDGNLKNVSASMGRFKSTTDKAKNSVSKLNQSLFSIGTAGNHINKLSKALSLGITYATGKKAVQKAYDWINEGVNYTEQLNLFNVVFKNMEKNGTTMYSNLGKEATKFQHKMNEAFGTNKTETLYMQSIFQSMGENLGIGEKYANIMSESMTKLTYDLASLYNKGEKETGEAIRSSVYSGQAKPLRSFGIDITQQTLQPIAEQLGITDRSIKQMSQAEKEILRYIATMNQAKIAMGDLASTIESPSNQLKVFKQQAVEAKIALSSLFMGTFASILPYANAILMVVKEVSKAIADMFGIKLTDYNSGIASSEDAYDSLTDSIDNTTDSVKKLKQQTLGIDELHVFNNDDSDSGASSLVGGIDQRLLDAIKGYDNGMDKVKMKATDIRDRIMEWLGFTKEIDPITGEIGFKLKSGETRFGTILDWIEKIKGVLLFALNNADTIIKTLLGYKITKKLGDVFSTLSNIGKLVDGSIFGKIFTIIAGATGLGELISTTDWYQSLTGNQGDLFTMWGKIGSGFDTWNNQKADNKSTRLESLYGWMSVADKAKNAGNDEVLKNAVEKMKKYAKEFDLSRVYEDFQKNKGMYEQAMYGESLFSGNGVSVSDYTNSLKSYFETVTGGIPNIERFNNTIKQSEENYASAETELGMLLSQMNTDQYEITATDIERINGCLERMSQASKEKGQAFTDSVTMMTMSLQKQGLVSEETAQKVIECAKKKQLAEQGMTEEYINKVSELDKKLQSGVITQKQYTQEMINIYNQYNKTADIATQTASGLEALSQSVKITGDNWNQLGNSVSTMGTLYQDTLNDINSSTTENLKFLNEWLSQYEKGTEEYELISGMIEKTNESQQQSIQKTQEGYANALNNILFNLVTSKEWGTTKATELYNSINAELSKIGFGVDEKVKEHLDKLTKKVGLGSEVSTSLGAAGALLGKNFGDNISKNMKVNGSTLNKTWNDSIRELLARTKNVPSTLLGGVASSLDKLIIPGFANGGFPEDGLFFANHNELVGKFANGKSAVANNDQIIEGIKAGVYQAVSEALQNNPQQVNVEVVGETKIKGNDIVTVYDSEKSKQGYNGFGNKSFIY